MGWQIGAQVKIGLSYIDCDEVTLSDNVQIGHFNIVRCLRRFDVGSGSYIANFNQFFGNKYEDARWTRHLIVGEKVLFMSHHFVDVAGTVIIGSKTTVGGRDTQVWSHSLTYNQEIPDLAPMHVHIGEGAYIGARATLVGCKIPDRAVVGAGSVVNKTFAPESCRLLIAGNPATIKKRYESTDSTEAS
jgi:serine acetyltransferase